MPTVVVGLTGNIASGKSSVRRLLAERGAATLDADALVRSFYSPGAEGARAVAREFGPGVLAADGSVDRPRLSALTMGYPLETARLEALIHPLVKTAVDNWISRERENGAQTPDLRIAVVEASLTIEASTAARHDLILVVDAPVESRRSRAGARGVPPEEFDRRESRMLAPEEKRRAADYVIDNDGTEAELTRQVDRFLDRLRSRRDLRPERPADDEA